MFAREHARTDPDEIAVVFEPSGRRLTYAEYEDAADRAAQMLRAAGLRRGDHVAFVMENNPAMLICEAGAERAGLYYTCINHHLAPDEAAYIIDDSTAKVVVTSLAKAELATQLPNRCPGVQRWLMADVDAADSPAPFESLSAVLAACPAEPIADEQLGLAMLYSSGTTGRPKGILRPLPVAHPADEVAAVTFMTGLWGMGRGSTYLSPAPLYHSAPQGSVSMALRVGAMAVVMETFDAATWLALVERHRVTHSQMVPTMFSRLLKLPADVREQADTSSLRTIIHSAAPCPPQVKQAMIEWIGPILIEFYAASEGIGFTFCDSADWLAHPGTVGRAMAGELVITDDDGRPCPAGVPGTIWFRGSSDFEYFRDPDKTRAAKNVAGTATSVGDVGYLDDEGYLYLTDRKTFMIISGGTNIYPQETENLLVTHPKVYDAAVIGVPHEDLGEVVKAVVQLVDGIEPSDAVEAELIEFCRANLAHYKCPRSVDFEAELPRLDTGKLYKRLLRDRYWQGHATPIG